MHCSPQPNISMDPGEKKRKGPKVFLSTTTSSDFYCCFFNSSLLSSNSHLKTHRNINHICSGPPAKKVQKAPLRNTPSFTPPKRHSAWSFLFETLYPKRDSFPPPKDMDVGGFSAEMIWCSTIYEAKALHVQAELQHTVVRPVCLLVSKTWRLVLVVVVFFFVVVVVVVVVVFVVVVVVLVVVVVVAAAVVVVVVVVQQDGMCTVHQESSDYLTVWRFP